MTAPVNPPLVALGQAKPPLQIEVVLDLLELARGDEEPGQEAGHQRRHVPVNRILGPLESIDQSLELLLAIRAALRPGLEGRGYFLDVLDILSDRLLLGSDMVQSPVDAAGQAAELLLREPPFFASKFRRIDSSTSWSASAIRSPGGSSGPP